MSNRWCVALITPLFIFLALVLPLITYTNKTQQIELGENPLRCTTQDKKGLVLIVVK
jgi:hypothetical protein